MPLLWDHNDSSAKDSVVKGGGVVVGGWWWGDGGGGGGGMTTQRRLLNFSVFFLSTLHARHAENIVGFPDNVKFLF